MSGALVALGVLLVVILVIIAVATGVRRSRARRRDETPEDRLRRAKMDVERSRAWSLKDRDFWLGGGGHDADYMGGVGGDDLLDHLTRRQLDQRQPPW
jgi:hypothetical protein